MSAPPMIVPLGHDLGPFHTKPGEPPQAFRVRAGDGMFILNAAEYQMWWLAHGTPELIQANPLWGRPQVEAVAVSHGFQQPAALVTSMLEDAVLVEVPRNPDAATLFARRHCVYPLQRCLGNKGDEPWVFYLGSGPQHAVEVDLDVFDVWAASHMGPSLWDVALHVSRQRAQIDGLPTELQPSAEDLVLNIMVELPRLLAYQLAYVERRI